MKTPVVAISPIYIPTEAKRIFCNPRRFCDLRIRTSMQQYINVWVMEINATVRRWNTSI